MHSAIFLLFLIDAQASLPNVISWMQLTPSTRLHGVAQTNYPKPVVVNTWPWTKANDAAWKTLSRPGPSAVDAVVAGCTDAEQDPLIPSVGYGGSPDEKGNVTLSSMLMDGDTMDVGAIAAMPYIKEAAQVARAVLMSTRHTLLVGAPATNFAASLGFRRTDLSSNRSRSMWQEWTKKKCQPNYRVPSHWTPDPKSNCGPYRYKNNSLQVKSIYRPNVGISESNHDTIGIIALDNKGKLAVGTSTNGAAFRIPGRVGDTPIPGAGGYADSKIGAAVATGDGDILMRYLLTFRAVDYMRQGKNATEACRESLKSVRQRGVWYGGLVSLRADGQYGAACVGFTEFAISVQNSASKSGPSVIKIRCFQPREE